MLRRRGVYGGLVAAGAVWAAVLAGCGGSSDPSPPASSPPAAAPPAQGAGAPPGQRSGSSPAQGGSAPAPSSSPAAASTPAATSARGAATASGHIPPAHPVPPSFRIAAGAPSDAEVRRELAEMKRIQRAESQVKAIPTLFSAAPDSAANLLPWDLEPKRGVQVSVASVFRDYWLGLACGGVLRPNELGVAHKTAPCGTLITFRYAGRVIRVPVIDRGPYIAGREWDLTGATADALGFPGLGYIQWSVGPLRGRAVVTP